MLNISNQPLREKFDVLHYQSTEHVLHKHHYTAFNKFLIISLLLIIAFLFLPWTQNVTGVGSVTTLRPDQRPQTIQSVIPGRIEKWHVREGDRVEKGDSILEISEIKSEYFDDKLLERIDKQIQAKASSLTSYQAKIEALKTQVIALKNERGLKIKQAKNKFIQSQLKVQSDSIKLKAAQTNQNIADLRYKRVLALQAEGLKSKKDLETHLLKLQATEAKYISQKNTLLESRNKVINAQIEFSRIHAEYADKISKAESTLYETESMQYDAEAQLTKLRNTYANYLRRSTFRMITAPQNGYINRAIKGGLGETFKAGEHLISIMPANYELAVETYVRPIDLPLIYIGARVRIQFDGWPAIVFRGWESISYGTYGGKVVAIENFISPNHMYRILLAPDEEDYAWPKDIRVGSGARTIALLNEVPIWYEIWRQVNGFPPDFYKHKDATKESTKK